MVMNSRIQESESRIQNKRKSVEVVLRLILLTPDFWILDSAFHPLLKLFKSKIT
jgi:hypothetical protein